MQDISGVVADEPEVGIVTGTPELEPELLLEPEGKDGTLLPVPLIRQLQPNEAAMVIFVMLFGHFERQPLLTMFLTSVQVAG
jgi:hypothetical protein